MWAPRRQDSAMETRPWTPPSEADRDDSRSEYFIDPFRPSSVSSRISLRSRRYESSTESSRAKTKEPTPFTPKRVSSDHAPRYPFTPDSSQVLRARSSTPQTPNSSLFTLDSSQLQLQRTRSSTPLSPIPWHEDRHDTSPVQSALSACISQFEHLIQTRHPTHDQMEYIVGQFEAMASYLSAPKPGDDADKSPCPSPDSKRATSPAAKDAQAACEQGSSSCQHDDAALHVSKEYVVEVERYIRGVAKYISDLQQRMEEVKALNGIQLEVIDDLRQQIKSVQQGMQTSPDAPRDEEHIAQSKQHESDNCKDTTNEEKSAVEAPEHNNIKDKTTPSTREFSTQTSSPPSPFPSPRARKVVVIRKNPASFWASVGDALDAFGSSLFHD